ncbi:MAG: hypothetical protein ACPIOQ_61280, partial [Promethearchaeia archaeon]
RGRGLRRLPLLRAGAAATRSADAKLARRPQCRLAANALAQAAQPGAVHMSLQLSAPRVLKAHLRRNITGDAIQSATLPKRLGGAALRTFFFALPPPEPALGLAAPFLSSFFGAIALRERMTSGAVHRHECRAGSERETRRQAGAGPATAGGRERVARHLP